MSATRRVPATEMLMDEQENHAPESVLSSTTEGSEHGLLPYLRLFWARRRFLFLAGSCAVALSVLFAFVIPVQFQCVTRVMPPDSPSGAGFALLSSMAGRNSAGGVANVAGDLLGVKSSGALFVGILGSRTVQDRLIEECQLMKIYRAPTMEDARVSLAGHTVVSEDRKSGIISIEVTDHDATRAAAMAKTYVNELDRLVAEVSTSSARRERIFLQQRLQKVKEDLDSAAVKFSDFASKNTAIDIPAQGKAMVEAAARLQGQLIYAQSELSALQQIYTENNTRVRAAQARVKELEKKLNEIGGAATSGDATGGSSFLPSIRKLPVLGVTYADLYRETKIQETVYELLTQQYELAKVQEAKEIPTVKVLDPAIVPTKKSFPPRRTIVLLGTTLGIALAMSWLLAKERWAAMDPTDMWKTFATEVFTTVRANLPNLSRNGAGATFDMEGPSLQAEETADADGTDKKNMPRSHQISTFDESEKGG